MMRHTSSCIPSPYRHRKETKYLKFYVSIAGVKQMQKSILVCILFYYFLCRGSQERRKKKLDQNGIFIWSSWTATAATKHRRGETSLPFLFCRCVSLSCSLFVPCLASKYLAENAMKTMTKLNIVCKPVLIPWHCV